MNRRPKEIQNVLVGYDGSGASDKALDFALTLAKAFGAALHIVAVVRLPDRAEHADFDLVLESAVRHFDQLLATLRATLPDDVRTEIRVVLGDPPVELVRYASTNAVDHIVVGHPARTYAEDRLLGPAASRVVELAQCPVTVVRLRTGS